MQYWTEEDGKQPFNCWLKQHTHPVPDIQQLRQQYHDMISTALVIGCDGQSEMDKVDSIIARIEADAAQCPEPRETITDLTSADASMAPGIRSPPPNTKGQRTKIDVKLRSGAAEAAKPAAKQPSLHANRRRTSLRSSKTKCSISTQRHQGKRHQSTVKANSSTHESQERPSINNNNASSTKQKHNAT